MIRSRRRHKILTRVARRVRLDLHHENSEARKKIIENSLDLLKHKIDPPPVTKREVPGYVENVCPDVRQEALNAHEKLNSIMSRIPDLSGRVPYMTFRELIHWLEKRESRLTQHALDSRKKPPDKPNGTENLNSRTYWQHSPFSANSSSPVDRKLPAQGLRTPRSSSDSISKRGPDDLYRKSTEIKNPASKKKSNHDVFRSQNNLAWSNDELIQFHESVRFGSPRIVEEVEYINYMNAIDNIMAKAREAVVL